MTRPLPLLVTMMLFAASIQPLAAVEAIDLATTEPETISVDAGELRIQLENALVSGKYTASWKVERKEMPPLTLETSGVVAGGESACSILAGSIAQITQATEEEKVKEIIPKLRGALPLCSDPDLVR